MFARDPMCYQSINFITTTTPKHTTPSTWPRKVVITNTALRKPSIAKVKVSKCEDGREGEEGAVENGHGSDWSPKVNGSVHAASSSLDVSSVATPSLRQ
jgi:hypothetical protein